MADRPTTDHERLARLLRQMIDIYSPSGKEEAIVEVLHQYLRRRGIPVERQAVDDRRHNLLVHTEAAEPWLCLMGHLDTVGAYDLDSYEFELEGDLVTGLGAADMKGGCAAMIEAFVALWVAGMTSAPVTLCLVVGEEEEGDGAERLLEDYHFDWAVVGEPTDLVPCLAHDGYLELELTTTGPRRHASLADRNQSAVDVMLRLILRLSEHLSGAGLVYNIRDLFSSTSGFVVPDRCQASIDVHLPPHTPVGTLAAELDEIAVAAQPEGDQSELDLSILTVDAGYELPEKGPLIGALHQTYQNLGHPWSVGAFRSHSDANQLWAAGVRPVILGPGRLDTAHTPDEQVSLSQVARAADIYLELLTHLPD